MQFDIPFYSNKKYIDFVNKNKNDIYSIYYRLPIADYSFDARNSITKDLFPMEEVHLLTQIPNAIKKYGLLNSKIMFPDFYSDKRVDSVIKTINSLINKNILDGILITDFMYLRRLKDRMPDNLISKMEIVPSVNVKLDNIKKISYTLEHIKQIGFDLPKKIILDRSLNRDTRTLKKIREWQLNYYPDIKIEILVNEGCLPYCPYKDSHDIFISIFNQKRDKRILELFRNNACMSIFKECWRYLTSPFIRPEDIKYISNSIDIIKIAGRTHDYTFIIDTFYAYLNRKWNGNLLQLLDTSYPISSKEYIDNSLIPKQFYNKTTSCSLCCDSCEYCKKVFDEAKVINPNTTPS